MSAIEYLTRVDPGSRLVEIRPERTNALNAFHPKHVAFWPFAADTQDSSIWTFIAAASLWLISRPENVAVLFGG
jgi:hypothetical protein